MAVKRKQVQYGGGVDVQGLGNVDFGALSADLAARFPSQEELQASSDALYDYRNSFVTDVVTPGEAPVVKPTETAEEKATRLQNEREDAQAETARLNRRKDARSSMNAVLSTYGLSDLSEYVYNEIIVKETVNINNPDAIIFAIREQPAYQKRFSANKERVKNGFDELDPASYIALEDQYRATLSANGMPVSFYDSKDDFDAMIGGSVSNAELQSRIQDGYRAVQDADPEVKRQMQQLYGVSEGDLAAYFIDPNRMKPLLVAADYKRQAQAAKIAARGSELAGIQLTGGLAEDLARRGITETEAETGFTAIGKLGELTTQLSGETALSQEQIIGQQFGTDTAAAQELEKRRRRRVGEFAGGGSFARTQGETSGATRLSVGKAE